MSVNLTAYSQITGLPKETKKEIVNTLLDYPLVLQENKVLSQKVKELEEIIEFYKTTENYQKNLIDNKNSEVLNLENQIREYNKELTRKTSHTFIYGQLNLNGWTTYGVGVDYVFKETIIIGPSVIYDSFYKQLNTNLKIGFKI